MEMAKKVIMAAIHFLSGFHVTYCRIALIKAAIVRPLPRSLIIEANQ